VTTENGMLWSMSDGEHWTELANFMPFKRIGVGLNTVWWAVAPSGELYRGVREPDGLFWQDTSGKGFEDVTVTHDGQVWLVGSNGTVWHTLDGQSFAQQSGANCFSVCAQDKAVLYFVLNDGTMWILQDLPSPPPPPPPPPPPVAAKVHLRLTDQAADFGIARVQWTVLRQLPTGLTPGASSSDLNPDLTLPANGQYLVHADVWVTRSGSAEQELADFRGDVTVGGVNGLVFVWSDADQTKRFLLIEENQNGVINPVVILAG
jgi:hypothetical protein